MNSGGTRGKKPNALSCLICPWRSFPAATQQHITASHHLGDLVTWLWGACVHEITGLPPCLSRDWDVARGYCSVFLSRKRVSVPQSCSAFSPFPPVWFFMQLVMTASYWQLCLFFLFFFLFYTLPLDKKTATACREKKPCCLLDGKHKPRCWIVSRENIIHALSGQWKYGRCKKVAWNWTFAVMLNVYSFGCWNANQKLLPVVIT